MGYGAEQTMANRASGDVLRATSDRPQTQVESSLNNLADRIGDVHLLASQLLERLSPVMNHTGAVGSGSKQPSAPVPVKAPLAASLDAQGDRIADIRDVLREIADRLAI